MPLPQGHQLRKLLVRNAWKVVGAFSVGVVAVVGGGLFLSNVHRVPQTARSYHAIRTVATSSMRDGANTESSSSLAPGDAGSATSVDEGTTAEKLKRSRRKKASSAAPKGTVPSADSASGISIAPGPDIAAQVVPREPVQLASILTAASPTLASDSPVTVRLAQQVSAKENRKGEVFKATLAAPLVANGIVLARAGAPVLGRIVDARSAKLFRGGSNLNLELTDVQVDSGRHLRLRTTQWYETGSHSKLAKAAIIPGEAAKKAASDVVAGAKSDGDDSDSSERTMTAKPADPAEKGEKKRGSVVLPPGSEIVFRLLEPIAVSGNLERR